MDDKRFCFQQLCNSGYIYYGIADTFEKFEIIFKSKDYCETMELLDELNAKHSNSNFIKLN